MPNETGVIIESGAHDYQVFQQDAHGQTDIVLTGRVVFLPDLKQPCIILRMVREDSGELVTLDTGWQVAEQQDGSRWSHTFKHIPCGGSYRIESAIRTEGGIDEWALRGDMVHHLGVGDIWIIAGQSNSAGYGKSPVYDPPEFGVHCLYSDGQWKLATHPLGDSTNSRYPVNREGANASHSPYLHFAKILKRSLNYPIGLIPTALGGSPISRWLKSINGDLFENMCAYCRDAGVTRIKGILWYQGESETGAEDAKLHLARFTELVGDFRRFFSDPDLPVITAQLNRYTAFPDPANPSHAPWELLRETQRQAARRISGVYVIGTLDLGLADDIHNNSSANMIIGERMAACALGGVHGRRVKYLHPDIRAARRIGPREVELTFDNVDAYFVLFKVANWNHLFSIRDAEGQVDIESILAGAPTTIRLQTRRDIGDNARVVGLPLANPTHLVPLDYAGHRPMLAFIANIV